MTRRVSASDLNHTFTRAKHAAESVGLDTSCWVMQDGGTTYAYRLFERDPQAGLSDPLGDNGFLGMTRREAAASLDAMARAWRAVADARDQQMAGAR